MHSIWAIAINTIKQALRMKIAIIFIVLLLILLPIMGVSMTGDGTLKGRLQTFISYGLSLNNILLCLLAIVVSVYTVTSDIKQRQIYTVITKPIRRFEFILGKLLGVILLGSALLIFFSAIIYSITIYMPRFYDVTEEELTELDNEFYTARASILPPEIDVSQEAAEDYKKLIESGQLEELFGGYSKREVLSQLANRRKLEKRAASVGQELLWEFNNIKPLGPDESLFIRFKYDVSVEPADGQVFGQWLAGDYRHVRYGIQPETPIYSSERKDAIRTFCEIEIPADAVAEDGYLAIVFFNIPLNNTVVIFPLEDGLELLYKADTFTTNFIRAVLLILFRMIFLACLGVLAASFLSFPVAILLCLVIFSVATISGFVLESFDFLSANLTSVYSYTIRPIIQLLPQFDKANPTKYLVSARLLSWLYLAKVLVLMVFVKAFLVLLLSLLVFSFREIAKIVI